MWNKICQNCKQGKRSHIDFERIVESRWNKIPQPIRDKIMSIETITPDEARFVWNYVTDDREKLDVLRDTGICMKFISA